MLKHLTITDFQSHKGTSLDLHPNYNVIQGQSSCGKTAIIRALKLLLYNKPNGTNFVRRPDGEASTVQLTTDKAVFERIKGPKVNEYLLNGEVFKDFGVNIPEDILRKLPIKDVEFDDNLSFNVQYAGQFDTPFLLLESPANKAKFLNKLSGTHILNILVKEFVDDARKINSDIKGTEEQLTTTNEELSKQERETGALRTAVACVKKLYSEYEALLKLYEDVSEIAKAADQLIPNYTRVAKRLGCLEKVNAEAWIDTLNLYTTLKELETTAVKIDSELKVTSLKLTKYDCVDFSVLDKFSIYEVGVDAINTIYRLNAEYAKYLKSKQLTDSVDLDVANKVSQYNEVYSIWQGLVNIDATIQAIAAQAGQLTSKHSDAISSYRLALVKYPNCPICGSHITAEQTEHYLETL